MLLARNFCADIDHKNSLLPSKLRHFKQRLNRLKSTLNRETHKMKIQQQSARKARTRMLISVGGLLQKVGLLEAFHIMPGDDLQDHENFEKATSLFGFLSECFEENEFDEANLEWWKRMGEKSF